MSTRLRSQAATTVLAVTLVVTACSGTTTNSPGTIAPTSSDAPIPEGELPPDIQCYVDHGFTLVKTSDPLIEGGRPGYELTSDLPPDQIRAVSAECDKLAPPPATKTDRELRLIYDRWVTERDCLRGLGYTPVAPPSFEKFAADWRSTGPWMPTDGIDTGSWTDAQYTEAKQRCGLEFYSRD